MNVNMGRGAVRELLRRSSVSRVASGGRVAPDRGVAVWPVLARVAVHRVYPIRCGSLQLKLNLPPTPFLSKSCRRYLR
jgi:hypothetical protein